MRKLIFVGLAVLGAALAMGCKSGQNVVPSTTIKWKPVTGEAEIKAPKNSKLGELTITRTGTNVSIVIKNAEFANDVDVVGASYAGQAAMLREGLLIGQQAIATGLALGQGRLPAPAPAPPLPPGVSTNK